MTYKIVMKLVECHLRFLLHDHIIVSHLLSRINRPAINEHLIHA